jgi:DNA-binding LytR/AlgR family response regulator
MQQKEFRKRFLVKKGSRLVSFEVDSIAYVYKRDRLQFIKTFRGEEHTVDSNLDELETQLDPEIFFRANRQFILSYRSIDQVFVWFDGKIKVTIKPSIGEDVIISRLRASDFKAWLGK